MTLGFAFSLSLLFLAKSTYGAACETACTADNVGYYGYTCGGRLGCDKSKLFYCNRNRDHPNPPPIEVANCGGNNNCQQSGDSKDNCKGCKTCPSSIKKKGNTDFYCGKTLGPNCIQKAIYICGSGGDANDPMQICEKECIDTGDGKARCASCKCSKSGTFCGSEIGCNTKHVLDCSASGAVPVFKRKCSYCSRNSETNQISC